MSREFTLADAQAELESLREQVNSLQDTVQDISKAQRMCIVGKDPRCCGLSLVSFDELKDEEVSKAPPVQKSQQLREAMVSQELAIEEMRFEWRAQQEMMKRTRMELDNLKNKLHYHGLLGESSDRGSFVPRTPDLPFRTFGGGDKVQSRAGTADASSLEFDTKLQQLDVKMQNSVGEIKQVVCDLFDEMRKYRQEQGLSSPLDELQLPVGSAGFTKLGSAPPLAGGVQKLDPASVGRG